MTDRSDPADETPLKRALRLKQEALQSKPRPPGSGGERQPAAGVSAGASRPWMKR